MCYGCLRYRHSPATGHLSFRRSAQRRASCCSVRSKVNVSFLLEALLTFFILQYRPTRFRGGDFDVQSLKHQTTTNQARNSRGSNFSTTFSQYRSSPTEVRVRPVLDKYHFPRVVLHEIVDLYSGLIDRRTCSKNDPSIIQHHAPQCSTAPKLSLLPNLTRTPYPMSIWTKCHCPISNPIVHHNPDPPPVLCGVGLTRGYSYAEFYLCDSSRLLCWHCESATCNPTELSYRRACESGLFDHCHLPAVHDPVDAGGQASGLGQLSKCSRTRSSAIGLANTVINFVSVLRD